MTVANRIGFIGLGVMGEPMCRNLSLKSGCTVSAFDVRAEPLARLAEAGVRTADSVAEVADADIVFLSLPTGQVVREVCLEAEPLVEQVRSGATVVDLGTSPVALARELEGRFAGRDVAFADAPVARTRSAAVSGTLSIMVGGRREVFDDIEPLLHLMGEEITYCGAAGMGQLVKIMNNMVLFQTVAALAEALTIGQRAGMEGDRLFSVLSKGSADSFALRNHGMKAMLPANFPTDAFPATYARKDLDYALELAQQVGLDAAGAELVGERLDRAIEAGYGENYFPVLLRILEASRT